MTAKGKLDPQAEAYLRQMEQQGAPPLNTLTPAQARETMINNFSVLCGTPQAVANVEDLNILSPAGQIPVRIYTPQGNNPFPILIYFHGGGWVLGNLDIYESACRSLANGASCVVVSVDYRLAPEHKFPVGVEDAYAATQWVADNTNRIKGDSTRIAVGGDSAGGNLAAVVSLMARDRGGPNLAYQLLVYPVTDLSSLDTASYRDYAEGYGLMRTEMEWFGDHYLSQGEDGKNPYVSPLLAQDLSGLPPALVITAEFDVLRDEGEAYANRLKEAGVSVKCTRYNGMIHGFMTMDGVLDRARGAIDEASAELRAAFLK